MNEPLCGLMFIFGAGMAAAPLLAAGDPATSPVDAPPAMTLPSEPEQMMQLLDEVRAQRQAWEQRRRVAKEAMDARRRWIDPWGAAQQETRDKETQLRRDTFREQVEREREAFLGRAPWGAPRPPWQDAPPGGTPAQQGIAAPTQDGRAVAGDDMSPTPPYPHPPGWDNRWYYRGY